ncbi:MAG: adenylyltransferase/cytidyltransferase family protein [Alphaproteobacteria bacterium]|nr:adenylyltransferase/cytidyltransferase family protein [Alphaproteobacteria bacterium]
MLVDEIRRKAAGRRIAFVSGNFNIVHPGHLRLLKFAFEVGEFLVVGVNRDSSAGVTVPLAMRLDGVASLTLVDHAFELREAPEAFIARLQPEVVVKGREYADSANAEQAVINAYGGRLLFGSGEVQFASIDLLRQEYLATSFSALRKPKDFPNRHGFAFEELKALLARVAGMRVLVVGDLIVDTYINCDALGMSQEDPTIVVTPVEQKTFVGGAGIVAAHARGLGAEARYFSVAGNDEAAKFAREELQRHGVRAEVLLDETRPTTHKQRYRCAGKTLLRVNHLRQHAIEPELSARLLALIERELPRTDLLLFSDFNYGCLPQPLVDAVVERAAARGIIMAADSQASSQLADIGRFRGMALITPTEREARLSLRDFEAGLAVLAQKLRRYARAANVIVTLGADGLLVHAEKPGIADPVTDRLPALNTAPKDPAGAGDSLFTSASMALCAGVDIWRASYFGALAAALQVGRVGNLPVTAADIRAEIDAGGI